MILYYITVQNAWLCIYVLEDAVLIGTIEYVKNVIKRNKSNMKVHKYNARRASATLCNTATISDKFWYANKVDWLSSLWKKVTCKNCLKMRSNITWVHMVEASIERE